MFEWNAGSFGHVGPDLPGIFHRHHTNIYYYDRQAGMALLQYQCLCKQMIMNESGGMREKVAIDQCTQRRGNINAGGAGP